MPKKKLNRIIAIDFTKNNPGPGTYTPEDQKIMETAFNKPPAFSFGSRHAFRGTDNTPGKTYFKL